MDQKSSKGKITKGEENFYSVLEDEGKLVMDLYRATNLCDETLVFLNYYDQRIFKKNPIGSLPKSRAM